MVTGDFSEYSARKIIFVGKMGTGKSSLANMLVQGDLYKNNIREVSEDAGTCTTEISIVDGREWTVCDTVGLGEMQSIGPNGVDQAMELLISVLKEGQRGFHYIAYVIKKDRLCTKEQSELFNLFKSTFQGADENFVLVITHCSKPDWPKKNMDKIKEVFGDIPVVTCDFPFDADYPLDNRAKRLQSLEFLEAQLRVLLKKPVVPKLSIEETATEEVKSKFVQSLESFLNVGRSMSQRILQFFTRRR